MLLVFLSVLFQFHIIPYTLWDLLGFSELSISSFCIHSFVIPTQIVNLFILYPFVCDTEAIVAEKSFRKSLGLLNGIGLVLICKYWGSHIPLSGFTH